MHARYRPSVSGILEHGADDIGVRSLCRTGQHHCDLIWSHRVDLNHSRRECLVNRVPKRPKGVDFGQRVPAEKTRPSCQIGRCEAGMQRLRRRAKVDQGCAARSRVRHRPTPKLVTRWSVRRRAATQSNDARREHSGVVEREPFCMSERQLPMPKKCVGSGPLPEHSGSDIVEVDEHAAKIPREDLACGRLPAGPEAQQVDLSRTNPGKYFRLLAAHGSPYAGAIMSGSTHNRRSREVSPPPPVPTTPQSTGTRHAFRR